MKFVKITFRYMLVGAIFLIGACSTPKYVDDRDLVSETENPQVRHRISLHMQLAIEYFQIGKHTLALEEVRQVLLISPNVANAFGLRALIQMDLNDSIHAEENFLQAMKLDPTNSEFINNYAWFLCQNGRERQSIPHFEKVISDRVYPTPGKVLSNAGLCALRLKDMKNAERYFNLAAQIDPNDASVNFNLAKISYSQTQYEKARIFIQRVIKEEIFAADVLWLAIKIDRQLGNQALVTSLATQLRRRHPTSKEYDWFQKGAFNE